MADTSVLHSIPVLDLTPETFAPFGEVIVPRRGAGQFDYNVYDPETSDTEAKLTLTNGRPRFWIMHLRERGLVFSKIGRHRKVTQCLGSLGGKEWLFAVAPPGPLSDDTRPRLEDITGFGIPGDRIVKLHIATWHAGPHFTHDECMFLNLENMDTNRRDFHVADLGCDCRFAV